MIMSKSAPQAEGARTGWVAAALGGVFVITAGWWALALWPTDAGSAEWLVRTREVCFGAPRGGLPDATGWGLMIGQPLMLLIMLRLVWGDALRMGFQALRGSIRGQALLAGGATLLFLGLLASAWRVADAVGVERGYQSLLEREAAAWYDEATLEGWPRLNLTPPAMSLVDQRGGPFDLAEYRGRPVLVTFAFGHCATICPVVVKRALAARDELPELEVAVVVVTLDPWRDTPSRLPFIAQVWGVESQRSYVLSGEVDEVERVLDAWNVARRRDLRTGDIEHPALTYVLDREGKIAFATSGDTRILVGLLRRL